MQDHEYMPKNTVADAHRTAQKVVVSDLQKPKIDLIFRCESISCDTASETSEMPKILQILHSALLRGIGVGNVGNTYRFPTVLHPPLRRPVFGGA